MASTSLGCVHQTLHLPYIATGHLKVQYGPSSWLLWILNSTLGSLERYQCCLGWALTGQLHATPVKDMLAEVNFPLIKTWAVHLRTIAIVKSLRKIVANPRYIAATEWIQQHTQKPGWCEKQVMFGKKYFVIPSPPCHPHLVMQTLEMEWNRFDVTIFTDRFTIL